MGMLPVPCPPSSLPIPHPPCPSSILQGFALTSGWGSLPHFPCPIFLPSCSPPVSASPIVVFPTTHVLGGLGMCPPAEQNSRGAWGQKPGQGSSHGAPLMGSPSHCPGRPCQIRQQRRSRQQRGWALPAAGTSRGAVSSSGGSGSPPPPSRPARRGDRTRPAPRAAAGAGHAPAAEPGPVSRRGGGGNRASRDRPGAGTSGTAGAPPPQRRPQVRAGLGDRGLGDRGLGARWLWGLGHGGRDGGGDPRVFQQVRAGCEPAE